MRLISFAEVNEVSGAMIGGGVSENGIPLYMAGETPAWGENWVVRYDAGGSWLDTGYSCVSLNPTPTESGSWSEQFRGVVSEIRDAFANYGCSRRLNIDPPCRFNIDPGPVAAF